MPKITEIKPTRVYKEVQTAYDRALLADTTATEAHTEETEQDDKIEFEE